MAKPVQTLFRGVSILICQDFIHFPNYPWV